MPELTVVGDRMGFTEGPVIADDGSVFAVSIDQGRLFRIDADGQHVHANVGGGPNGATETDSGLMLAQNGGDWGRNPYPDRRDPGVSGGLVHVSGVGSWTFVSTDPAAPNDLCVGPDGMIYVMDPTRVRNAYTSTSVSRTGRIWRCDPATGVTELLASVDWFPNGIGFGPDDALYVAASNLRSIVRYELTDGGLSGPSTVIELDGRIPDGFAFDTDGNLIIGALGKERAPGRVEVWSTTGDLVRAVEIGDDAHPTNVALAGDGTLVVTNSLAGEVLRLHDFGGVGLALYPRRRTQVTAPDVHPGVRVVGDRRAWSEVS